MVKFEIEESLNFRGGSHYCYVYANDIDEVIDQLKDAWYSSGIHRHGGELFLNAYLKNAENKEVLISCGHCSVDSDDDLYSVFDFPYDKRDRDQWYSLGLFLSDCEGESFEDSLEYIFDIDSPDRILGSYLFRLTKIFDGLTASDKKSFGENVLANILSFAKKHKKLNEMYAWLRSEDGVDYLNGLDHAQMTGAYLADVLQKSPITDLNGFISKFKKDFGTEIYLPSSMP